MSDEMIDMFTVTISSFFTKEQLSLIRSFLARIQTQMTVKVSSFKFELPNPEFMRDDIEPHP
jgi:hypothetical protein